MDRHSRLLANACAVAIAASASPLAAQEHSRTASEEQLQRELAARDAIIADLLARVEQLERAIAAAPQGTVDAPTSIVAQTPSGPQVASGPVRAATAIMEAEADRALERTLVQAGALLLPSGRIEIAPQLGFTRQVDSAPTFVFVDDEVLAGTLERRRNQYVAGVSLRFGLPLDSQFEVDLPYQIVNEAVVTRAGFTPLDETRDSGSAFGDVGVALAHTLLREKGWLPDLVGRLRWNTGSGSKSQGGVLLGGGFASLGGSLTAIKRQDPLVFVGSLSYDSFFAEDMFDPGDVVGVSLGTLLAASPETSLRLALDQRFFSNVRVAGISQPGSDRTIAFVTAGASSLIHRGVLLDVAARFGLTDDSPDYSLVVSLPIRF